MPTGSRKSDWRIGNKNVDTEDELDICEEWAHHLLQKGWRVGRWRQTHPAREDVKHLRDFKNEEKKQGALLLMKDTATWNFFFYEDS